MVYKEESMQGLVMLKLLTRKLQRAALLLKASRGGHNLRSIPELDQQDKESRKFVSKNEVKKGQFAVTAIKDGNAKRFTLELDYLNDPHFLRLLELAEDEFGFRQQGVLAVPCHPDELHKILRGGEMRRTSTDW